MAKRQSLPSVRTLLAGNARTPARCRDIVCQQSAKAYPLPGHCLPAKRQSCPLPRPPLPERRKGLPAVGILSAGKTPKPSMCRDIACRQNAKACSLSGYRLPAGNQELPGVGIPLAGSPPKPTRCRDTACRQSAKAYPLSGYRLPAKRRSLPPVRVPLAGKALRLTLLADLPYRQGAEGVALADLSLPGSGSCPDGGQKLRRCHVISGAVVRRAARARGALRCAQAECWRARPVTRAPRLRPNARARPPWRTVDRTRGGTRG